MTRLLFEVALRSGVLMEYHQEEKRLEMNAGVYSVLQRGPSDSLGKDSEGTDRASLQYECEYAW